MEMNETGVPADWKDANMFPTSCASCKTVNMKATGPGVGDGAGYSHYEAFTKPLHFILTLYLFAWLRFCF